MKFMKKHRGPRKGSYTPRGASYSSTLHLTLEQRRRLWADRITFAKAMRDAGHKLVDIGEALGVSRERARQLIVGGPHTRGVSSGRMYGSDIDPIRVANALREYGTRAKAAKALGLSYDCVAKLDLALKLGYGMKAFRARQAAQRDERRRWLVSAIQGLARELGRTPTAAEVGALMGKDSTPYDSRHYTSYASVFAAQNGKKLFGSYSNMIKAAGLIPRGRGGAGHLIPCAENPRMGKGRVEMTPTIRAKMIVGQQRRRLRELQEKLST